MGFSPSVKLLATSNETEPELERTHGAIGAVLIAWTLAVIGVATIGAVAVFLLG